MTEADADLSARVRRHDEDRWLAAQFAPAPERERLIALYAFHLEVARVAEVVSEPMIGEIRLAWWREALEEIDDPAKTPRRHEVVEALAAACAEPSVRPPRNVLEAVIDARGRDLDDRPFADIAELSAYAEATAGGLMRAALLF
ncbi:MAG: squalene/phytoene synthase family protein, partial [Caulobacterales bacterium]|nr:squalene/phytoene synthase family protein [Caulobacterales bacterium]